MMIKMIKNDYFTENILCSNAYYVCIKRSNEHNNEPFKKNSYRFFKVMNAIFLQRNPN